MSSFLESKQITCRLLSNLAFFSSLKCKRVLTQGMLNINLSPGNVYRGWDFCCRNVQIVPEGIVLLDVRGQ